MGILPGIKVDTGVALIEGTNDETYTQGLDGLGARTAEYYAMGCRFAKWRAVVKIGDGCPSELAITETAHALATRYGALPLRTLPPLHSSAERRLGAPVPHRRRYQQCGCGGRSWDRQYVET